MYVGTKDMKLGDPKLDLKPYQKFIVVLVLGIFVTGLCGACYGLDRVGILGVITTYASGLAVLTGIPAVLYAIFLHPVWLLVKVFGEPPVDRILLLWNKPAQNAQLEQEGVLAARVEPAETETAGLLGSGGAQQ
ncbi:hypothetical protein Vretimale_17481 [Volvox reticuliferus]|uniref:Uncharacterized protein n=1 Tax=Volvox reticuliferus TaxID=1737510 RepID=A0A8J4GV89_9CHLO|nr:hypothetical protein Vretimale_17481 [Volvox reticuliferus]